MLQTSYPSPTIFALSTAPGLGALAIVRLSGPESLNALRLLSGKTTFAPRHATRTRLYDCHPGQADHNVNGAEPGSISHPSHLEPWSKIEIASDGSRVFAMPVASLARDDSVLLDEAIAVYYPAPHSFTGEDCAELTLHGGRATTTGVLAALGKIKGLRLAEPGEFTRRAFENGKMDLTQAEAIADLIHAETTLQRNLALSQLSGRLRDTYHGWAARLTTLLAYAEADIDFPDEDLPDALTQSLLPQIQTLAAELADHLADNRRGERLRDGITIAILGAPNAGKSTLLNTLARRDAAIVSPAPGTTRDVIEVHLDLGGYPVTLLDTAGLRETQDSIEAEGIRRARARADEADIKLCLFAADEAFDEATKNMVDENTIVVVTKCDVETGKLSTSLRPFVPIPISATTGQGLETLLTEIQNHLEKIFFTAREVPTLTRARHREALTEALAALRRADETAVQNKLQPELLAEDLRLALRALGRITGRVDVEDLLDKIFKDFCIGK